MSDRIDLRKYIEIDQLQKIQNNFSALLEVGTSVSDAEGSAITQHTGNCDFCKFTRISAEGSKRCRECDREGAKLAAKAGKAVSYVCHAGLVDFVAPIIIEGQLVGCFSGGQVRYGELDEQKVRQTAVDLGINPEMYLMMAKKAPVISKEKLEQAMEFIYNVTNTISDMVYKQFLLEQSKAEVEYAAKLKADFLANMSHEIRTPMNGVIGMAELALREELPVEARNYINQIKISGKTLLAIINDILDFSKIESGKMTIQEDEYEPLSIVNDVMNVILTRIGEKPIDLILDVDANLPFKLYGDNIRITQILMNLANNAVKFTKVGRVKVSVKCENVTEDSLDLKFAVQDTGIGISEEDLTKLFQSFQQVDSKRNREVEGTGLGLAISKQLTHLMNGEIGVESTYGEGSTFWFSIPQKITKNEKVMEVQDKSKLHIAGILGNPVVERQLQKDIEQLGGVYKKVDAIAGVNDSTFKGIDYLFVDDYLSDKQIESFAKILKNVKVIDVVDFREHKSFEQRDIVVMKKPLYALNLVNLFNHSQIGATEENTEKTFAFIAPNARILIVDDNAVNLTVAAGLLRPLKMHIDTAFSGKDALEKIIKFRYDLIFMDHMMPELDGVETTHIIRRLHPDYNDVPIIALTANVVTGAREMFIQEGMNDIVAKPIETKAIMAKLQHWLPREKQIKLVAEEAPTVSYSVLVVRLKELGLDTAYALQLMGDEDLYLDVVREFYKLIEKKAQIIQELYDNGDWGNYTIEVHALKSSAKQIGIMALSEKAAEMEKAGNGRDINAIREKNAEMLEEYLSYREKLQPLFDDEEIPESEKAVYDRNVFVEALNEMKEATDNLDMDEMERIVKEMLRVAYPEELDPLVKRLAEAADAIDIDSCERVIAEIELTLDI